MSSGAYFTSARVAPEPHLPPGWQLKAFETLDSTNTALRRLVEQGADVAEGLLVWAHTQTAGRGRSGRSWTSPPGNVYASYLVRAPGDRTAAPEIGFVCARAVVDTILELPRHNTEPPKVSCKWPNDVLIEGHKVSGILPELAQGPDGSEWIILGVGINVVPVEVDNPGYPVTALAEHHIDVKPAHVLTVLSRMLERGLKAWRSEGFGAVREAWLAYGPAIGAEISVNLGNGSGKGPVRGAFAGLDSDGALLLDVDGRRQRILAGDVLMAGEKS